MDKLELGEKVAQIGGGRLIILKTVARQYSGEGSLYNFFVEPQCSVADRGPGQPGWQVSFCAKPAIFELIL